MNTIIPLKKIDKLKIDNIALYLDAHNINSNNFNDIIKNIYSSIIFEDKKLLNKISNKLYEYIIYNNDINNNFYNTLNNKLNNFINIYINKYLETYNDIFPEKSFSINNEKFKNNFKDEIEETLKNQSKIIKIVTKLTIIKNINFLTFYLKENKFDNINRIKVNTIKQSLTMFTGFLWEQLNKFNTLFPRGYKKIINNNKWNSYIKTIFPNINKIYKEFDLHIIDTKGKNYFIELKNYFVSNDKNLFFFKTKHAKEKIMDNLEFSRVNKCKVYYYLNNIYSNEEILIPIKDLYNLLQKNNFKINFNILINYVQQNYPENYKKNNIKKFNINNINKFLEDTINLYQKNITEVELLIQLNSINKEDFFKQYDEQILKDINSKEKLKELFFNKNLKYIGIDKKEMINNLFNNFIPDNLDFSNKESLNLHFNNLKNALNNIFELEGRSKISLDKTNIEKYYRSRKVIDTMKKHGYSMNIIFDSGSYEKFLKKLTKNLNNESYKKIIKNRSKDYYQRIKPYFNIKNNCNISI